MIRQGTHAERSHIDAARKLRKYDTYAEEALWHMLRGRRLLNLKFRRQHQIGDYIVDFYCLELKLVVELDGAGHFDPVTQLCDNQRTAWLQSRGMTVTRFENVDVLGRPEWVRGKIEELARELMRLRERG